MLWNTSITSNVCITPRYHTRLTLWNTVYAYTHILYCETGRNSSQKPWWLTLLIWFVSNVLFDRRLPRGLLFIYLNSGLWIAFLPPVRSFTWFSRVFLMSVWYFLKFLSFVKLFVSPNWAGCIYLNVGRICAGREELATVLNLSLSSPGCIGESFETKLQDGLLSTYSGRAVWRPLNRERDRNQIGKWDIHRSEQRLRNKRHRGEEG